MIGRLRRRFHVEAPVAGVDGMLVYQPRAAAWGALEAAREGAVVRLRARSDVDFDVGWRLRLGLRTFEITARQRDENASGYMACACREIAP